MIKKLDKDCGKLQKKINELVDAVNELQEEMDLASEDLEEALKVKETYQNINFAQPEVKENVDPYAEQCKWIGKLCWFWNNDIEPDTCFGVLTGVFDKKDRPFERNIGQQLYRYCEPVKPDDDIIYKGE